MLIFEEVYVLGYFREIKGFSERISNFERGLEAATVQVILALKFLEDHACLLSLKFKFDVWGFSVLGVLMNFNLLGWCF